MINLVLIVLNLKNSLVRILIILCVINFVPFSGICLSETLLDLSVFQSNKIYHFSMCLNRSLVFNKFTGRFLYRPCGKCDACKQAKADKQASRIRSHKPFGLVPLFVHLTYMNECVPYIRKSELLDHPSYCNVYRDYDRRLVPGKKHQVLKYIRLSDPLDEVEFVDNEGYPYLSQDIISSAPELQSTYNHRPTTLSMDDKIGIIYYPDFQKFMKRLKINLQRNFNFDETLNYKISFYSVSEYGGEKYRPHFHVLIWVRPCDIAKFKRCILKSWPYAFQWLTLKRLEVAVDAASYVASYVNKSACFPKIFESHSIKQKHSFSQGFGLRLRAFQLDKILEKVRDGNLKYNRSVFIKGVPASIPFVYPKYVISRYFPKYKGFSRLTDVTIQWLLNSPERLQLGKTEGIRKEIESKLIDCCRNYKNFVLFREDLHKISVSLVNKILLCNMSPLEYGRAYTSVWRCYNSTLYRDSLENTDVFSQWESYDNIQDYFEGKVRNDSLDELMLLMPKDFHYEVDPNRFHCNVADHERLHNRFMSKLQQHQINESANVEFYTFN